MALNDNIRKLREENNLTQQQLADRLYVPDKLSAGGKMVRDVRIWLLRRN